MGGDPWNSKLTPERHAAVVAAQRRGLYLSTTAKIIGISERTIRRWFELGERDADADVDSGYSRLYLEAHKASAEWEAEMMDLVADAARANPQNWAAAMTILERKFPDRFGRRDTTVLEGGERPAIVVNVGDPDVRDLARGLLTKIAQPGPPPELIEGSDDDE